MFLKAYKKFNKLFVCVIITGVLISVCSVFGIYFYQKLIDAISMSLSDSFKVSKTLQMVMVPLSLYAAFIIGDCIFNYIDEYPLTRLQKSLYYYFKIEAVRKISRVDYLSVSGHGTGKILQMVESGATAGRDMIVSFYVSVVARQIPRILLSLYVLGSYSINIMIVIVVGYIVVFLITKLLMKKLYDLKNKNLVGEEMMSKQFVNCLMEFVTFRVNSLYKKEIAKMNKAAKELTEDNTKIRMIHEAFFSCFYFIIILIKIVIIVLSLIVTSDITIGSVVAMVALVDNIYNPIALFNVGYIDYKLNKVTFDRYCAFMKLPDDSNMMLRTPKTGKINGGIELSGISFNFGNRSVLKDINICVRPGMFVAIVGESGSGKSTIAKLLMGLLKYETGEIRIDGIPLNEMELETLYAHSTYISQDTPVFDATLRENIILEKEVSDDEIARILPYISLSDLVNSLPEGLDTLLGEKGINLSGGERQRIAMARVYFDNSEIVILDEATSAMDYLTEARIVENLYQYMSGKTLVIIAHRLSTIAKADHIYVMREGIIIQQGNYETLMEQRDGYFYALWSKQKDEKVNDEAK